MTIHQNFVGAGIEVAGLLGARLDAIDQRILSNGTKEKLEVNRPGRKVPHYQFVPSHHHPDPFGVPDYKVAQVHKKVGKTSASKRGRK